MLWIVECYCVFTGVLGSIKCYAAIYIHNIFLLTCEMISLTYRVIQKNIQVNSLAIYRCIEWCQTRTMHTTDCNIQIRDSLAVAKMLDLNELYFHRRLCWFIHSTSELSTSNLIIHHLGYPLQLQQLSIFLFGLPYSVVMELMLLYGVTMLINSVEMVANDSCSFLICLLMKGHTSLGLCNTHNCCFAFMIFGFFFTTSLTNIFLHYT